MKTKTKIKDTYYLYLIKFSDGRYYIGSRGCNCRPEQDTGYMGSPTTFKQLWTDPTLTKTKHILREVNSVSELRRIEPILIKAGWARDGKDVCVNRHASPTFHPEVCSKGGKISGAKAYELGTGIHKQTREEKSMNGKKGGKVVAERYSRNFTIVSPEGKVYKGRNLRKFCRDQGLDHANIRKVLRGVRLSSGGWTQG
jgi:hypothetical protein